MASPRVVLLSRKQAHSVPLLSSKGSLPRMEGDAVPFRVQNKCHESVLLRYQRLFLKDLATGWDDAGELNVQIARVGSEVDERPVRGGLVVAGVADERPR